MIVAEKLGIPIEDIDVLHSDTAICRWLDSYGSRSLAVGGTAVNMATDRVLSRPRTIAAHRLEIAEDDLEYVDGEVRAKGGPSRDGVRCTRVRGVHRARSARRHGAEPRGSGRGDPPSFTFPFGVHVAVVEIDEGPATSSCRVTSPSTTAATRSTR